MSQGLPPTGPPPSTPPPSGPPPFDPRPQASGRRGRVLPLVTAAVVGLLVGVAGTVAVVAATSGGSDDLDLACAAVEEIDVETAFEDGPGADLYRILGAGSLFLAAADGEDESRAGQLGTGLSRGPKVFDQELTESAVEDAEDYCDDR